MPWTLAAAHSPSPKCAVGQAGALVRLGTAVPHSRVRRGSERQRDRSANVTPSPPRRVSARVAARSWVQSAPWTSATTTCATVSSAAWGPNGANRERRRLPPGPAALDPNHDARSRSKTDRSLWSAAGQSPLPQPQDRSARPGIAGAPQPPTRAPRGAPDPGPDSLGPPPLAAGSAPSP